MFQRVLSFGGMLLLAGAAVLTTAGPGQARGAVGFRFGGLRIGGFRGGFYPGGYRYWPYYGYRNYYPYYGYSPYSYPYGYGYPPYPYGYDPYDSGYAAYSSSSSDDSSWYPGLSEAYSPGVSADGFTSVSPLSGGSQGLTPSGQPDTTAHVTVRVPAGADVWINGSKTYSAGPVREFQSPSLTRGQQYTYEFRARWKDDDGREVTQTQQVAVTAGGHARVEFPVPDGTRAKAPTTNAR